MNPKKGYTPGDVWKNYVIAFSGTKYPHDAEGYILQWLTMIKCMPKPGIYDAAAMEWFGQNKKTLKENAEELNKFTRGIFKYAIENRDGSTLRMLADLIEEWDNRADKHRSWLMALCFDVIPPRKQKAFYTCKQLVEMAYQRKGFQIDNRQMLRYCNELGIKLRKAKEGCPKGTKKTRTS